MNWWLRLGSSKIKVGKHVSSSQKRFTDEKGERVIHYSEGQIRAVGTVAEDPITKDRHSELPSDVWEDQELRDRISELVLTQIA